MKTNKIGKIVFNITAVSLAILVADCIVLGGTASISMFTAGSLHAVFLLLLGSLVLFLMVLFIVHLVLSVLSPRKKAHFAMLLLIPITVITAFSLSPRWEHHGHRRWFFQTALPEYQVAVEKILRDTTVLKDQDRLYLLVDHPAGCPFIRGETRADGSVVIYFSGGDHWREGYIYYSGGQMSSNTNSYLTNGWFEAIN